MIYIHLYERFALDIYLYPQICRYLQTLKLQPLTHSPVNYHLMIELNFSSHQ